MTGVEIRVLSEQDAAQALNLSLGFETYGWERRALKIGERYLDNEHMVLRLL
jgi:hypothetical protein